jgi:hypothetical protein
LIWIFAIVLIALAVLSPSFRRFGLALAGAAIALIIVLILINDRNKPVSAPVAEVQSTPTPRQKMMDHDEYMIETQDKRDPDAKRRIALSEVRFGEIQAAAAVPGGVFQSVQARLYNDSPRFTLTDYSYDLIVQDCVLERCTVVYEQRKQGVPVVIPPMQARDITIWLKPDAVTGSPSFKLLGKAQLQLTATDIRAYQSPESIQPELAPVPGR